MNSKKSFIHKLGDYAGINSLTFGGLVASYLYSNPNFNENPFSNLYPLGIFAGTYCFYDFLINCRRLKEPIIKNYIEQCIFGPPANLLHYTKSKEKVDEMINILKEKRRGAFLSQGVIDLEIGGLYIKKNDLETGVEYFRKAFEFIKKDDFKLGLHEKIVYNLMKKSFEKCVDDDPGNIDGYFDMICLNVTKGYFNGSVEYWNRLCNLNNKYKIDLNILSALFLESLEQNPNLRDKQLDISSDKQWVKTLEIIIKRNDLNDKFKSISAESRNRVLEYGPTNFLKNTFIFKTNKPNLNEESNKEEIKKGFFTNLALYQENKQNNEEDKVKLVRSLGLFENVNEHIYDISQRKSIKNLEDLFIDISDEKKTEILLLALDNQRKLHKLGRNTIKKDKDGNYLEGNYKSEKFKFRIKNYDYRANLSRRLFERLGFSNEGNEFSNAIIDELKPFTDKFNTLINGDLSLPNILEDGTIIDFEKACYGNPVIDIVTTLEDTQNKGLNKNIILDKSYLSYLDKLEKEYLEESYNGHSIFISACQVGSKVKQRKSNMAKEFLSQFLEDSKGNVKDKFVKYIRSLDNINGKDLQKSL